MLARLALTLGLAMFGIAWFAWHLNRFRKWHDRRETAPVLFWVVSVYSVVCMAGGVASVAAAFAIWLPLSHSAPLTRTVLASPLEDRGHGRVARQLLAAEYLCPHAETQLEPCSILAWQHHLQPQTTHCGR